MAQQDKPGMDNERIGHRIAMLRQSKRLSQQELAEMVGVSRSAVAQWESHRSEITAKNIIAVSSALSTSPGYLRTGALLILDEQEGQLIESFRGCPSDDQAILVQLASKLRRGNRSQDPQSPNAAKEPKGNRTQNIHKK